MIRTIFPFRLFIFALLPLWCTFDSAFAKSHSSTSLAQTNGDAVVIPVIQRLLDQIDEWNESLSSSSSELNIRPFVTVSFAQSLDAKIAICLDDQNQNHTTANYPLSGPESLLLTHGLRSIHDGILVGGRTLSTDNPRLTNRLWGVSPSDTSTSNQPRPIVLDSELRHVRKCFTKGLLKANNLIVCCSKEAAAAALSSESMTEQMKESSILLLPCEMSPNGRMLDLKSVLSQLKAKFGMQSIMVEGGSAVISAFVQANMVDCVCVTIAPKVIGSRGLPAFDFGLEGTTNNNNHPVEFEGFECASLGDDCIVLSRKACQ
jgi:2,5-diamino-6-(ribosylamino)-4(3H)-pyrimidinone 5'-phosphate reductase